MYNNSEFLKGIFTFLTYSMSGGDHYASQNEARLYHPTS